MEEKKTKKIVVEKGYYDKNNKRYETYYVKGTVRGKEIVAGVKPADFGGYAILDVVFNGEQQAELQLTPYAIKAENGEVITGNTYKVVSYDEDGTTYECPVKPSRDSDKIALKMLIR